MTVEGLLLARGNPRLPEQAAELDAWYADVHLGEILSGSAAVRTARSFRAVDPHAEFRNLAVYELVGEDLGQIVDGILRDGPSRTPTDALAESGRRLDLYELIAARHRGS
ncbi:hypothetical protein [Actinophytocola sp.]|uniref:hypothetical protein n=1 Tax=Actinophytocola sp. TaxID=1872138 RepID=UPI003D6C036F